MAAARAQSQWHRMRMIDPVARIERKLPKVAQHRALAPAAEDKDPPPSKGHTGKQLLGILCVSHPLLTDIYI